MPVAKRIELINVKSKNPNVGSPFSATMLVAKILAGVPIKVREPPNREEKDSGISNFETGTLVCRDMLTTAGSNIAVAPTLFMKAEMMPQAIMITAIKRISLFPDNRRIYFPKTSATPVLNNPPETM